MSATACSTSNGVSGIVVTTLYEASEDGGKTICLAATSSSIEFLESESECPLQAPLEDSAGITLSQQFQDVESDAWLGAAVFEYPTPSVLYQMADSGSEQPMLRTSIESNVVEQVVIDVGGGREIFLWLIGLNGSEDFDLLSVSSPDRVVSYSESNRTTMSSYDPDDTLFSVGKR